jgi:hypothetical protein
MTYRIRLLATVCVAVALMAGSVDAKKKSKGAITKLTVDPKAPVVQLFEAMDDKKIAVKLIQISSKKGNLLVENMTDETITVQLPEAFVGVHVLNQIGGLGGGLGGGGQQGGGGGGQTAGGGGGQQGGGLGGGGQQGGIGGGGNFFSIPPEKLVRVSVTSVCLEYGKPEPTAKMEYRIMPVEAVSKDPVLKKLLTFVATGRINENSAQAAAWVLASGKTWNELANLKHRRLGGRPSPHMFNRAELLYAQNLIAEAKRQVEADKKKPKTEVKPKQPRKERAVR